jgi:formate-dependent nitrite reductase membrane component NrfD
MSELTWEILMVIYLFLGGLAGGSYIISALVDLFKGEKYQVISKSAVLTSLVAIIASVVVLLLEIKRFKVQPLVFLFAYVRFPNSMVSVGTWILTSLLVVSVVSALLRFLGGNVLLRKIVAVVGLILGLSTTAYTGLLLSYVRGISLWNTPFLPWTFIISGILTGLSTALFLIPIFAIFFPKAFMEFKELWKQKNQLVEILTQSQKYITILVVIELCLVIIELLGGHSSILLSGSWISLVFYGYLIIGLLAPLGVSYFVEKFNASGRDGALVYISLGGYALILAGGFLLRYVVLIAGQLIH